MGAGKNYYFYNGDYSVVMVSRYVKKSKSETYCYLGRLDQDNNFKKGTEGIEYYVLYNLPDIARSKTVIFVEYEEDADYLKEKGYTVDKGYAVTTYPANARKWRPEYSIELDRRDVVILLSMPDESTRQWYREIALRLLRRPEERTISDGQANSVKLIELPYPENYKNKKYISDWWAVGSKSSLDDIIAGAQPLSIPEIKKDIPLEESIERHVRAVMEETSDEDFVVSLEKISNYRYATHRQHFIKKLARKYGVSSKTVENDFIARHGTIEAQPTNYFPGLIDLVDDAGILSFLLYGESDKEEMLITETHVAIDNQTFTAPKDTDVYVSDFSTIRDFYSEAHKQHNFEMTEFSHKPHVPSEYLRQLFSDLKSYLQKQMGLEAIYLDVVAYFVLLTYIHDRQGIEHLPFLHLLFSSVSDMEKIDHDGLAQIVFRGVVQNYLNQHHIVRLTHDYAATILFKRTDFEKTVVRENLYDFIKDRHKKKAGSTFRINYSDFKEKFSKYRTFSPTIVSSVQPITDAFLRSVSIVIPVAGAGTAKPAHDNLKERLIAWRALLLGQYSSLPKMEDYPAIARPLIQVCYLVNPDGLEALLKFLDVSIVVVDPKERILSDIVEVLVMEFPKHGPLDHNYGTVGTLTNTINRYLDTVFTSQHIGNILKKDLNVQTQTATSGNDRGKKILILTKQELESLRIKFKVNVPLEDRVEVNFHRLSEIIKKKS